MKVKYIQYYVEGECEEKLINVLKSELMVIKPGKVQKFNVIEKELTNARLITLRPGTAVVLLFDTDTKNAVILNKNIRKLLSCSSVEELILIPQIKNLEDELKRSCNIKNIKDLLGSKTNSDFKNDFIRATNLKNNLKNKNFDIGLIWSKEPSAPYNDIKNGAKKIKIK